MNPNLMTEEEQIAYLDECARKFTEHEDRVDAVKDAWRNPGGQMKVKIYLQQAWPTLAAALEVLASEED